MILSNIRINFSCELGQIMTRYDILEARRITLGDLDQCSNLLRFLSTFHAKNSGKLDIKALRHFILPFKIKMKR